MSKRRHAATLTLCLAAMLTVSSCDGLLGSLYDDPPDAAQPTGFQPLTDTEGLVCIDSRRYDRWTYIDLHNHHIDTAAVGDAEPLQWDFALHHYDARTHHGEAAESVHTLLADAVGQWHADSAVFRFAPDVDSAVAIDLSGMVTGDIVYAPSPVNAVLSQWMHIDLSHMPPTYTPSQRVYLLRMADSSVAALRFERFTNASGDKGFLTIRYQYPL